MHTCKLALDSNLKNANLNDANKDLWHQICQKKMAEAEGITCAACEKKVRTGHKNVSYAANLFT